jgi:hypothetical protein
MLTTTQDSLPVNLLRSPSRWKGCFGLGKGQKAEGSIRQDVSLGPILGCSKGISLEPVPFLGRQPMERKRLGPASSLEPVGPVPFVHQEMAGRRQPAGAEPALGGMHSCQVLSRGEVGDIRKLRPLGRLLAALEEEQIRFILIGRSLNSCAARRRLVEGNVQRGSGCVGSPTRGIEIAWSECAGTRRREPIRNLMLTKRRSFPIFGPSWCLGSSVGRAVDS